MARAGPEDIFDYSINMNQVGMGYVMFGIHVTILLRNIVIQREFAIHDLGLFDLADRSWRRHQLHWAGCGGGLLQACLEFIFSFLFCSLVVRVLSQFQFSMAKSLGEYDSRTLLRETICHLALRRHLAQAASEGQEALLHDAYLQGYFFVHNRASNAFSMK